jgi:hypothetical protein
MKKREARSRKPEAGLRAWLRGQAETRCFMAGLRAVAKNPRRPNYRWAQLWKRLAIALGAKFAGSADALVGDRNAGGGAGAPGKGRP